MSLFDGKNVRFNTKKRSCKSYLFIQYIIFLVCKGRKTKIVVYIKFTYLPFLLNFQFKILYCLLPLSKKFCGNVL